MLRHLFTLQVSRFFVRFWAQYERFESRPILQVILLTSDFSSNQKHFYLYFRMDISLDPWSPIFRIFHRFLSAEPSRNNLILFTLKRSRFCQFYVTEFFVWWGFQHHFHEIIWYFSRSNRAFLPRFFEIHGTFCLDLPHDSVQTEPLFALVFSKFYGTFRLGLPQ